MTNTKRTPRKMNFISGMISLYLSSILYGFLVEALDYAYESRPLAGWFIVSIGIIATLLLVAGSYLIADFLERLSCAYQYLPSTN